MSAASFSSWEWYDEREGEIGIRGEHGGGEGGQIGRDELTLTIGGHVWHAGILHHSCRAGASSHHGGIGSRGERTALGRAHRELLLVVHHLLLLVLVLLLLLLLRVLRLLVLGGTRLHVCVLRRWGTIKGRAALGVWEAIVGRIHDWRGGL